MAFQHVTNATYTSYGVVSRLYQPLGEDAYALQVRLIVDFENELKAPSDCSDKSLDAEPPWEKALERCIEYSNWSWAMIYGS